MTLALTLFYCWLLLWLLQKFRPEMTQKQKLIALLLFLPVVSYPFIYSPLWWLRGLTGDLSMLSLLLLASAIYLQLSGSDCISAHERRLVEKGVAVAGLIFYPLALGFGNVDPYGLGYGNLFFVSGLLVMASLALIRNDKTIAVLLLLALFSWSMQLLQSVNLWDYLLDPFIFFFYLGRVVRRALRYKEESEQC